MFNVVKIQLGPATHPQEDSLLADENRSIFLVADGVTRTAGPSGYPNPSPAKIAADRLLTTTHRALQKSPHTEENLRTACRLGNEEVRRLNKELGLWDNCDWLEKDLAGTVFAGLLLNNNHFIWGFLTDCGVARLSPQGEILWITPDRLAPVRQYFPPPPQTKKRQVAIRRDFRNRPDAGLDRTYGVFTGEDGAMPYLGTGTQSYNSGDILLVYSDGARHLIDQTDFRTLLLRGSVSDLTSYISQPAHCSHQDDKTVIIVRTEK